MSPYRSDRYQRHPVQWASLIVGAGFLAVGILGFIPGVTENLDQIEWVGHDSGAELLGIFQVSILHNIVHLLFGIAGIALAASPRLATNFLIGGGVIYLILWVYGLVVESDADANFVPFNEADNWLHLGLGLAMVLLGFLLAPRRRTGTVDLRDDDDVSDVRYHERQRDR